MVKKQDGSLYEGPPEPFINRTIQILNLKKLVFKFVLYSNVPNLSPHCRHKYELIVSLLIFQSEQLSDSFSDKFSSSCSSNSPAVTSNVPVSLAI